MLKIAVIGLGYVGLPLLVELHKKNSAIGFDIDNQRIEQLKKGVDSTFEVKSEQLKGLSFTSDSYDIEDFDIYIVTVPTPVDKNNVPELGPLIQASRFLGTVLKRGNIVIYESTVYPGATEEICIPELEKSSGLLFNQDFFVGYSPERINPGDKVNTLVNIKKVTSGSTPETALTVDKIYSEIIEAGTHKASSIKVAEASKVIENTQRDLNIALMNELAIICNLLDIDTNEVLEAASTKWNFLKFKPGLVGGHCIGVDPYYLSYKSQSVGFVPDVILSARRINDSMGAYIANELIKLLVSNGVNPSSAKILLLGFSFKENCPDIRNTKVIDIVTELRKQFQIEVSIFDPIANKNEVLKEYGITPVTRIKKGEFDLVALCVGHDHFVKRNSSFLREIINDKTLVYDVKGVLPLDLVNKRL